MARVKRMERVVALTKQLVDHPYQLFSFTYFCKKFEVAILKIFFQQLPVFFFIQPSYL